MTSLEIRGGSTAGSTEAATGELVAAAVRVLAASSDTPQLDAELLLALTTGRARSSIVAFPERVVDAAAAARFAAAVERRACGEPLAYIIGVKEFFSLELRVTPDVLIPRPETELLVEEALARLGRSERPRVLDLGTGSGALALAIKHERPSAAVTGVDVSAAALAVARGNAARLGLDVRWLSSDWLAALAAERYDAIVCNPPYVPSGDPAFRGAPRFEPRLALDGGADGLHAFRLLLEQAPRHLAPGGWLLLEHGADQELAVARLAREHGLDVVAERADLAGHARVLVLRARSPS